jgi:hypothetical protein
MTDGTAAQPGTSELAERIRQAGRDIADLRAPLEAGEPWPLSGDFGTGPEASWGPPEVLAHVEEMLVYWTEQLGVILAGDPASPTPFGRVATDPNRLARIGADRTLGTGELLDRVAAGIETASSRATTLTPAEASRVGLHPIRGEVTVAAAIERFLVTHLEEHVAQLREIIASPG